MRVLLSYYGQHVKEFEQRIAPMLKKGAKYEVKLEGKRLVLCVCYACATRSG